MKRTRIALLAALQFCGIAYADARPAVFWFNDPAGPDETVLVTGTELDKITSASIAPVGAQESTSKAQQETAVDILQANPLSLKFVIPKEFAPGIYRFTLTHAQGSLSGLVNRPTVYWTQGSHGEVASPGDWIQVFGRNIVRRPDRAQLVLLPEGGGAPAVMGPTSGDMWRGAFRIPDRLPPGRYSLRLSNGDGGDSERVDAGSITVRLREVEPTQSFDIRAYGAIGDGKADCTRAIKAAIDAANEAGGGTVYLPRGRYLVSDTLVIPPRVSIRGERIDLVNLVWPDFERPPAALLRGTSHFSIENLTIYASNHAHIIVGGFAWGDTPAPGAGDIAIRRVRIRASAFRGLMEPDAVSERIKDLRRAFPYGAPDTIRLSGNRLEVSDCDVLGSGHSLLLFKATHAVVSGNTLSNGRYGAYFIIGSRQIIFENNVVNGADLQATGGGINTLSKYVSASENIFVGGNTFRALHGWDREAVTSDGPGGYYFGRAESTAPNRLSLLDAPNQNPVALDWVGAIVMVVNGRGAGQYGRVASFEGKPSDRSITLDRALQVALDPTSEITVAQAQQNYLIIGNSFEDTGVAAQSYGTALGHVIAGNRSNRTSGFTAFGMSYGHFQPGWRIQILDNHILEGNVYRAGPERSVISHEAAITVQANQTTREAGRPPLLHAVIVRGNRLDEDAHIEVKGFSAASPGVRDVVVEANTIGASRTGLLVDRGVAALLSRRNVEERRIGR